MSDKRIPDIEQLRGLLNLFVLEKALYELRYELNNRLDWLAIPLRGILELIQESGKNRPAAGRSAE